MPNIASPVIEILILRDMFFVEPIFNRLIQIIMNKFFP